MKPAEAFDALRRSVEGSRPAGAYLLGGAMDGAAGETAVRLLQFLFCEAADRPCGACRGCRLVAARKHADVLWVEPALKSRRIAVDEVRAMQERVFRTSLEGGWRACVLCSADRLTEGAANALLKTLEEPPRRCLFLLVSDAPSSLPATVRSRCQALTVEGGAPPMDAAVERRVAAILAERSGPRATRAVARAEELVALLKELKDAAAKEAAAGGAAGSDEDADEDTIAARAGALYRQRRSDVLRFVEEWHRDVLLWTCGGGAEPCHPGHAEATRARAAELDTTVVLVRLASIAAAGRRMERNVNERVALQACCLALE
jgi:DNA polymerase-3 subunit delta'